MSLIDVPALMGPSEVLGATESDPALSPLVVRAEGSDVAAYRRIRHDAFVAEQAIFSGTDRDDLDDDPRTIVLVARVGAEVIGGVRIAPATAIDIGWWTGSRLVVAPGARGAAGIGSALVRAACALAEQLGVIRFDATVQERSSILFRRIGWETTGTTVIGGVDHRRMRWPIGRYQWLVDATKSHLAALLEPGSLSSADPGASLGSLSSAGSPSSSGSPSSIGSLSSLGGAGWLGDDGAPVPGTDVIAACDAILPSMVERDPEWAGWCGVLVNVNDLSAMGAAPVGLLDAVAGRDAAFVRRVLAGVRRGAEAWGVPLLGGHTQVGAPASLSITALGRTSTPVPGGGGRLGDALSLTVDVGGSWRPGYSGSQWNSTEARRSGELRDLAGTVARAQPAAAKDVSMAGIVGTVGMLAEASGYGAVIEVGAVPVPGSSAAGGSGAAGSVSMGSVSMGSVSMGDWLGCFPGFGMVTADRAGRSRMSSPYAVTAEMGELTTSPGVRLRWPDGETTLAVSGGVTGLGPA
ncbi:MSMEG_0567/sll0787 family protein [Frondihabitans sp. VKM Ac-2883]|uniref:MSMEG_0567/sll0787 family protein n=1 Tax=Frondihabitans sp. VKM Ac-2883 TaxID=2783823 RepID=UPI00351C3EB5